MVFPAIIQLRSFKNSDAAHDSPAQLSSTSLLCLYSALTEVHNFRIASALWNPSENLGAQLEKSVVWRNNSHRCICSYQNFTDDICGPSAL